MAELDILFAALLARADDEAFRSGRAERLALLDSARKYYDGEHKRPLKVRQGERDDNVIINLCRALVNRSVAWLFGGGAGELPAMELVTDEAADQDFVLPDDAEPDEDGAAEAWLEKVWLANGGARVLQRMGRRGAIEGHVFVKVVPAGDPGNALKVPRVVVMDAAQIYVIAKPEDKETAQAFVQEWTEPRVVKGRKRDVTVRQMFAREGDAWYVARYLDTGPARDKWQPDQEPALWPHSWAPIVDWQNLPNDTGYYGASELEDLTGINDSINFTASNVNRIIFIHGHPRTIGTGFTAAEVQDTSVDAFWTIPSADAKVQNLEMQSDLSASFRYAQYLTQSFWDIGRELDVTSLQERIGQVTNFGLRTLASSALAKLDEKRVAYGEGLMRINRILLELGGYTPQDTLVHWRDPLPENAVEDVGRLKTEREIGIVSRETAATERGRDWPQEQERMTREGAMETNVGAALLSAFEQGGPPEPVRPPMPAMEGVA